MFSKLKNKLIQSASWQEVGLGSSNRIFKAEVDGLSLVLRLNADTNFAFGVDRLREAKVLKSIKDQAWAPKIIENNLEQGWCLMLNHGDSLKLEKSQTTNQLHTKHLMLDLLKKMHQFSENIPNELSQEMGFDYQGLFASYVHNLQKTEGNFIAIALCNALSNCFQKLPSVSSVLVHQDLHPQNICVKNNSNEWPVIIDWEYGGWGNPWLDIAALNSSFSVEANLLKGLAVFQNLSFAEFSQGLQKAIAINQALECIWYWIRALLVLNDDAATDVRSDIKKLETDANQIIKKLT